MNTRIAALFELIDDALAANAAVMAGIVGSTRPDLQAALVPVSLPRPLRSPRG
jgi:hypothetical protein